MKITPLVAALALALVGACKDENPKLAADASKPAPDAPPAPTYSQIEQFGRPGINEALLRTNAYLNGYNETAPGFVGVPAATLQAIEGEAEGTLEAIYLGVCLTDGVAGLTAATGLKPAGMQCAEVGTAVFNGSAIAADALAGAQTYAQTVFGQFEPDVQRIDVGKTSGYLTLCGGSGPLLCGGRNLTDDVIDITYDYLLDGASEYLNPVGANPTALQKQVLALVSDGVIFDNTAAGAFPLSTSNNPTSLSLAAGSANFEQGHPLIGSTFPFSAPPI